MSVHVLERSGHVVSLRGVVTVPWKEANDTEDAMSKALLVASKAEAAAAAAEGEAAAVEPFMMFRWLASAETLKKAARLRAEADDARRKAEAASKTARALQRFVQEQEQVKRRLNETIHDEITGWGHVYTDECVCLCMCLRDQGMMCR